MSRQWVEFELALPSSSTVEIYANDAGGLACVLEAHNDHESLVQLADTLRQAVVEVDAQRAKLGVPS